MLYYSAKLTTEIATGEPGAGDAVGKSKCGFCCPRGFAT